MIETQHPQAPVLIRRKTETLCEKLKAVIPGGVNSPVRSCAAMQQLPMIVERGLGDTIWDVDGHAYIDYCGSWGALIHGHAHPDIVKRVQGQVERGTSFGITCASEEALATRVTQIMPHIQKVRFVSSGTEATMTAVRLARGFTGRDIVVKFAGHYHGHSDAFLVQAGSGVMNLSPTSSSAGIPESAVKNTFNLTFNSSSDIRELFADSRYSDKIAAVILEPVAGNMGLVPPQPEFLKTLREETTKHGALLIFDEVITGFRVALGGAQAFYNIQPDLTCLGKIVGGGLPAAAVGGRKEIMDFLAPLGPVYQAGTLSGNPLAMEAGDQALQMLQKAGIYELLEQKTNVITVPIAKALREKGANACIQQVGSMFTLFFGKKSIMNRNDAIACDNDMYARFFRHLFAAGIYIPPLQMEAWFVSLAHTDANLIKTRDIILEFIDLYL